MNNINTNKIDSKGITALRAFIDNSDYLSHDLKDGDKKPVWDGEIVVYKSKKHSNSNLKGRIPVQVKSSQQKISNRKSTKIQIKVVDLIAYKNDGGILLFYVNLASISKRIFLNVLMPYDLDKLIKKAESQKKTGVELFEIKKIKEFENKCSEFLYHRKNQMGILSFDKSLVASNLSIRLVTDKGANPLEELISKPQYVYIKSNPDSLTFDSVRKLSIGIGGPTKKTVKVDGKVYYKSFEEIINKDTVVRKFGKGITIFVEDRNRMKIWNNPQGNIEERINDAEFIIDILSKKSFSIDNEEQSLESKDKNDYSKIIKSQQNYLNHLNNLVRVFKYFNVDHNLLDIEKIKKGAEQKGINILLDGIVHNNLKSDNKFRAGKYKFEIGNISLLTYMYKSPKEEKVIIEDLSFFGDKGLSFISPEGGTVKDYIQVSPYVFIDVDHLTDCINLPLNKIYNSIIKFEHTEGYDDYVNELMLKMIMAYDIKKDNEYLNCADKLLGWLEEADCIDIDVIKVNRLQIKKRNSNFTAEDYDYLIKLKSQKNDDVDYLMSIYILLGDKKEFDKEFKKLDNNKQKIIKDYPMYNLIK